MCLLCGLFMCLFMWSFYVIYLKNNILQIVQSAPNALLTAALIYYIISELSEDDESEDESEDDELLLYISSCN